MAAAAGMTFEELGLAMDKRVDKAIMKCGFVRATAVQAEALPAALAGKDLLVKARTGSGKTIAYLLPLLNKVVTRKSETEQAAVRAIVLVPTKELVAQVAAQLQSLMYYCKDVVRVIALANEKSNVQRTWLQSLPDVIISTPGRLALHLKAGDLDLKLRETMETFVVDEADLIFSFGYSEDVNAIVAHLPRTVQSFLMSATLNAQVLGLRKLMLHSPQVIKIEEAVTDGKLAQWYCKVKEEDKYLLLFALLRLKLISGKTLFFVNSVNRAYQIKLVLEQYHVKAAVLNAELPMNSRLHILDQFNRGVFDYLIATDEATLHTNLAEAGQDEEMSSDEGDVDEEEDEEEDDSQGSEEDKHDVEEDDDKDENDDDDDDDDDDDMEASDEDKPTKKKARFEKKAIASKEELKQKSKASNKRKNAGADGEDFGVARGVDFQGVVNVINIDLPSTSAAYIHRVGRTARGGASGTALSIVAENKKDQVEALELVQSSQPHGEDGQAQPALLALDLKEIEGFRYRVRDITGAVTRDAIKEARMKELRNEMVNSEKLKAHFEDNPTDLGLIKHDSTLRPQKVHKSIEIIPSYLMPTMLKEHQDALKPAGDSAPVSFFQSTSGRKKWKQHHRVGKFSTKKKGVEEKQNKRDPRGKKRRMKKASMNPLF